MKPDAFAAVMATGIVSVAAYDHGYRLISVALMLGAAVLLPVLVVAMLRTWRRDRWSLREIDVCFGLFTYVAACCVLATRLDEHRLAIFILLPLAIQAWLSLTPPAVRALWRAGWTGLRDRAHGGWELASVATSGLAMVFVAVGVLFWAVILWTLALAMYLFLTGLVAWRWAHDRAERRVRDPDSWIVMGAPAIATLAGEHLHHALAPGPFADGVRLVTIVTWVAATLWIPVLLALGLRRVDAWPAVFPLGMYSSATYAMAAETGWAALGVVSLGFCWIAFGAWLWTAVPAVGRVTGALGLSYGRGHG
ncbi:tellurite resistance/C4-dicarboxylate transporter family protein [Mycolicibacterium sp. F2034L]|uniref:tellurite resistance/C4-dicarboxylate transporter family protein n=1 Tax=Mycolicibacterium sp. F2034L TaxID=2926422 RepID=UPI001FF536F9|nr:tellurite resistance/C4-dicarboxylate transporter family protein [Mycolicibacterium sp. F2034L]MCK0172570.1 tellurite resistance/C4-dicarboxylate transporter family protein [Mycolicibacterium sp. F2034L]